jgi:hypothetical protein
VASFACYLSIKGIFMPFVDFDTADAYGKKDKRVTAREFQLVIEKFLLDAGAKIDNTGFITVASLKQLLPQGLLKKQVVLQEIKHLDPKCYAEKTEIEREISILRNQPLTDNQKQRIERLDVRLKAIICETNEYLLKDVSNAIFYANCGKREKGEKTASLSRSEYYDLIERKA